MLERGSARGRTPLAPGQPLGATQLVPAAHKTTHDVAARYITVQCLQESARVVAGNPPRFELGPQRRHLRYERGVVSLPFSGEALKPRVLSEGPVGPARTLAHLPIPSRARGYFTLVSPGRARPPAISCFGPAPGARHWRLVSRQTGRGRRALLLALLHVLEAGTGAIPCPGSPPWEGSTLLEAAT